MVKPKSWSQPYVLVRDQFGYRLSEERGQQGDDIETQISFCLLRLRNVCLTHAREFGQLALSERHGGPCGHHVPREVIPGALPQAFRTCLCRSRGVNSRDAPRGSSGHARVHVQYLWRKSLQEAALPAQLLGIWPPAEASLESLGDNSVTMPQCVRPIRRGGRTS